MKNQQTPSSSSRRIFLDWYHVSTFGQILQSIEASYLQSALKLTYNDTTLQVGHTGAETLYIDPDLLRKFVVVETLPPPPSRIGARIIADLSELPVATESIDVLILPHVLEFGAQRHELLQEAARVLRPEGRLFILCLNPLSLHGILQYWPRSGSYWRSDFVTRQRLLDWLSLLKFDAEYSAAFSISSSGSLLRPSTFWQRTRAEVSFAFAIRAIKRRYNFLPLDTRWISVPSLAAGSMFEKRPMPLVPA